MNIALSALLIILFLLPAFFFRIGASINFKRKLENKDHDLLDYDLHTDLIHRNVRRAFSKLNFTETVFLFCIIPLILHLISIALMELNGCNIDYQLLLNIFSGKADAITGPKKEQLVAANNQFAFKLLGFLSYSLLQAVLGFVAGGLISYFIGGKKWVLRVLMGNNIWFKIFSGSSLRHEQRKELASVMVEVLTVTKEASIIYGGLLKSYEITEQGDMLASITVASATRRDLRAAQLAYKLPEPSVPPAAYPASETTTTYFDDSYGDVIVIPGHLFTIQGKEIQNVNVTYTKFVIDPETGYKVLVPVGQQLSLSNGSL